eukprot:g7981.t1
MKISGPAEPRCTEVWPQAENRKLTSSRSVLVVERPSKVFFNFIIGLVVQSTASSSNTRQKLWHLKCPN